MAAAALALQLPVSTGRAEALEEVAPQTSSSAAGAGPKVGSCTDCIGEFNDSLNACQLSSRSCASTQNEDEAHFVAPWQYDGAREEAVRRLIEVATGGTYDPGLLQQPFGISRTDAAAYIVGGVGAVLTGGKMPQQPKQQRAAAGAAVPFVGTLADRHTTDQGSEYVRISFAPREQGDAGGVVDAEFLFLDGDNIVDIRAASRAEPEAVEGMLGLSLSQGLIFDANEARRKLEKLRKALRWEEATVLTDFDPRYNQSQPMFFDKLYKPFERLYQPFGPPGSRK